jgi:hypothetical protein
MGLFSDIGGIFGGNKAGKRLSKDLKKIAGDIKFNPFDVNGPLFSGSFDPENGTATSTGSNATNAQLGTFDRLFGQVGEEARGFNPTNFQNNFFDAIDRLESRRESEAFNSLESKLFNKAGVSTGTERQVRDFQGDLEQRRFDRAGAAVGQSQQFFTNMLQQLLGISQGKQQLASTAFDPLKLGLAFGGAQTGVQESKANILGQAAGVKASTTANTFSSIGGLFDSAAQFGAGGGFGDLSSFFGGGGNGGSAGFTGTGGFGGSANNVFGEGFF